MTEEVQARKRRGRPHGAKANLDHGPTIVENENDGLQLSNRRHEIFARYVSNGETYSNAYVAAGFNANSANASTLAKKPEIRARIEFLKKEKAERDLRFDIELRKANLDPNDPVKCSREVAEWGVKQVLDLFWENARLAQVAGEFKTANESLEYIAKIMGLLDRPAGNPNDKPAPTQIGVAIYQDAAKQLEQGGGVSISGSDNPLAPRIPSPKNDSRDR